MARTDFIENDRVLVTNRNGTSFRGLLSQLVTYIGSFLRPYKVYTFGLFATGLMDPTVTIYENTIGDIVWTRDGGGDYSATLSGAFTSDNKTWMVFTSYITSNGSAKQIPCMVRESSSVIKLYNTDTGGSLTEPMYPMFGEIRVYN